MVKKVGRRVDEQFRGMMTFEPAPLLNGVVGLGCISSIPILAGTYRTWIDRINRIDFSILCILYIHVNTGLKSRRNESIAHPLIRFLKLRCSPPSVFVQ